jgi:hypothetical protein
MALCAPADRRLPDRPISSAFPPHIEGINVNAMKMLGIVLLVGGILGLIYGGFTYTKDTHEAKIGPIVMSIKDNRTVNIPIWAGVGAIVIGGLLLVSGSKKS